MVPEFSGFPYQPYDIQQQLMRNIYLTLENSKVGILESPTGTVRRVYRSFVNFGSETEVFAAGQDTQRDLQLS